MNSETASIGSSLIWVHVVCILGYQVHQQIREQTTFVVNSWEKDQEDTRPVIFTQIFGQIDLIKQYEPRSDCSLWSCLEQSVCHFNSLFNQVFS